MVLFTSSCTSGCGLPVGLDRRHVASQALATLSVDIIFNLCRACANSAMSCIPPSAFSAARIRESQRDPPNMKMSKTTKIPESRKFFETATLELSPVKYNSKLMNSIWGFYNRYSPHNVKKVNDDHAFKGELQQIAVNSAYKPEPVISLPVPTTKLDNVWAAIKASLSHQ